MIKKTSELILICTLAFSLTFVFYFFTSSLNLPETSKTKIQINLENASHRWNDLFYKAKAQNQPNEDVIVLAIDEESVIEIGRWPWSRKIINQITEQLLKYEVKTIAYDIIFSESENTAADSLLAKTLTDSSDKITLGTFSDSKYSPPYPYQDFCMTQAFLYSDGGNLAKINPFFSVDDESNPFEEIEFGPILFPIFNFISKNAEQSYIEHVQAKKFTDLSSYQINTLNYFKTSEVYTYCDSWLTAKDPYSYSNNPELAKLYLKSFKVETLPELEQKINLLKKSTFHNAISQYRMWRHNIKELQDVAQYTASFVAHPDADGIIRSYPLVFRTGNQLGTSYIPSLALQSYLAATGYQALFKIDNIDSKKTVGSVEIKDVSGETEKSISSIPVTPEGKLLIKYYGKQNTIKYVSAKELLNNSSDMEYKVRADAEEFVVEKKIVKKVDFLKNKNIIFGATAIGIYDIRTIPHDINYPGPETHATVLSNLFNKEFLAYDKYETENAPLIFFILITFALCVFVFTGIRIASIFLVTFMGSIILLQNYLFENGLVFHSTFIILNMIFIAYFACLIYKYFFQSKKSKEMKSAFSKYVSKDVVNEILQNESAIELRGQKLHMSVYFSDIRGFTEFSEKMDPVMLSDLLNKYFTPMSKVITEHNGTIDKYIGDAIMAMFGAPINYKDHAYQACLAALGCVKVLKKINEDFKEKNWPEINIGIGINTGYMNAGNIGSETIQNYTVIGDSVNLASRLEGLNKNYGTQIIISEYTYEIVRDKFICRELDKVAVKGKSQPVTIYELICTR